MKQPRHRWIAGSYCVADSLEWNSLRHSSSKSGTASPAVLRRRSTVGNKTWSIEQIASGAGTNLKVGGTGREWKWGHRTRMLALSAVAPTPWGTGGTCAPLIQMAGHGGTVRRARPHNYFLGCALHFLALKAQLVVLVSAFVVVSTVGSVSCLLFSY